MSNPVQTGLLYSEFLNSEVDQNALIILTTQELDNRLIEEFGSTDYLNALNTIQSSPANFADGRWGFSHAALTILKLETLRLSGGNVSEIEQLSFEEVAYWYSKESIARCNDDITDWLNPLNWSEDSRLDYMTPRLFVEWYLNQL